MYSQVPGRERIDTASTTDQTPPSLSSTHSIDGAMLGLMNHPRRLSAKVITVINLKGGVGKTHTVWLLSSVCQERSLRLLAVDTDTQANLTNSLLPERDGQMGVQALFNPASDQQANSLIR